jgi:hypothetical protein
MMKKERRDDEKTHLPDDGVGDIFQFVPDGKPHRLCGKWGSFSGNCEQYTG